MAGDVKLARRDRIKKDKMAKSDDVAKDGLIWISRTRRWDMNGTNLGNLLPRVGLQKDNTHWSITV